MLLLWCIVRLLALLGLAFAVVVGQSPSAIGTSVSIPVPANKAVTTSWSVSTATVIVTVEVTTGTPFPVPETFAVGTSTITASEAATRTSTETARVTVTLVGGVPQPPVAPRSPSPPVFLKDVGKEPGPSVTTVFVTWTITVPNLTTIAGSTRTRYVYEVTTIGPVAVTTATVTTTVYLDDGVATTAIDGSFTLTQSSSDISTTTSVSISISTVTTSFFNSPGTNTSKGTMMTMRTTSASSASETSTGTAIPVPPPGDFDTDEQGGRTRKAGIIIGGVLVTLLLIGLLCWLFGRFKRQREEKKKLIPLILPQTSGSRRDRRMLREYAAPRTGGSAGVVGALRTTDSRRLNVGLGPRLARNPSSRIPPNAPEDSPYSTESGSHGGFTGEGEVRIVIRPAPSRRRTASSELIWSIPPCRSAPDISLFMEHSPSRHTSTSPENPDQWSIASDQGSRNSPFRSAGPSQGSSGGRQESYPMVTMLSPTPAGHRDRRNLAPWESPIPQRSATEPVYQSSPESARTARTGRSSNRPLLGGSSRFKDII